MGVIWITGLAGAGKSTIANAVSRRLRSDGIANVLLDGDALRDALNEHRYDRAPRLQFAYRISRLAQLVARQEIVAVVATVSLFHEIHAFNRTASTAYFEVFIDCAPDTVRQRSKLYDGDHSDLVGFGQPAEFPRDPHFVVDNHGGVGDIERLVAELVTAWKSHAGF